MGVGGYLSAQAERKPFQAAHPPLNFPHDYLLTLPRLASTEDHYRYLLRTTRQRVKRSCAGEIEREVTDVLSSVGLDQSICRRVAHGLMKVEKDVLDEESEGYVKPKPVSTFQTILRSVARKPKGLLGGDQEGYGTFGSKGLQGTDDVGLTAFLIKFAEGQEEVPNSRLIISALTIGTSYAVGGIIPLIPYFFTTDIMLALYISILITGITLIVFGIAKAYYTGSKIGWKGYTKSAVSTLAIGGLAAGSAYGISKALEGSL
jgi:VIT1/CCC1 family predicted Fe2+/Mn2+ transporter